MRRVIAANVIQRFWRRRLAQKKSRLSIVKTINERRSKRLINRWLSNLIFQHRMVATQTNSYYSSIWKKSEVYLHLDIYMNMPEPTNFLRYPQFLSSRNDFFGLFHTKTQVQIVEAMGRKWLKICYPTSRKAAEAQKKLFQNTYRYYYNGFSIRFFSSEEIKDEGALKLYESRLRSMFRITV